MAKEKKVAVSFSVSPEEKRELDEYCAQKKITPSALAKFALWRYLRQYPIDSRKT